MSTTAKVRHHGAHQPMRKWGYPPSRLDRADTNAGQTLAGGKVAHLFQDHLLKFRGLFLSHRTSLITPTLVPSMVSFDGYVCVAMLPLIRPAEDSTIKRATGFVESTKLAAATVDSLFLLPCLDSLELLRAP
jgi:hypothetical protein